MPNSIILLPPFSAGLHVVVYIVTRFISPACQYVNALDGLSSHRLGLFYAMPTPIARNLLHSQHSFICISLSVFALFTL